MPEGDLKGISVVTHKEGLKLPENFDARTAWPQCRTIADILGQLFSPSGSCFFKRCANYFYSFIPLPGLVNEKYFKLKIR